MSKKRIVFNLEVSPGQFSEDGSLVRLPKSTILTAGEHNGITFLPEEIAKIEFPPALPLTLDHSRSVADEVGWWESPEVVDGTLRAVPVINLETAKGAIALGYVKNRMAAGLTPEVSVEVWVDLDRKDGKDIARNITLDKASLVDRGACGPDKGCGIGLQDEKEVVTLGVVPKHLWEYGKDAEGKWEKPTLTDFTDKAWADLTTQEQKSIAGHYAWSPANPPERFTDLKLPHHRPKTHEVVWNGVRAAMAALLGARGGVDIPSADKPKVYKHLAEHYKEFDKTPPEVTFGEDNEPTKVVWMEEEDKLEFGGEAAVVADGEVMAEAPAHVEETTEAEPMELAEAEAPTQPEPEPDYKALYEEASEKVKALTAELERVKATLNAYVAREREELIETLKEINPNYDATGKSNEQLRELVEFAKGLKPPAKRKSFVIEAASPEDEYVLRLKKKMAELKRRD